MNRVVVVAAVTVAVGLAPWSAPRMLHAQDAVRLFLPDGENLQWMNVWVALGARLFAEDGLDVQLVHPPRTGGGARFLTRGRADLAVMPRPMFLTLVGRADPVVAVANLLRHDPINLVVSRSVADARGLSPALSLADRIRGLHGLRVGVAPGPRTRLDVLLRTARPDADHGIEIVTIPGDEQNAALRAGRVDALYAHTPYLETALVDDGAVLLVNQSEGQVPALSDRQIHMMVTTRDFLETRPEAVAAAVRAIGRAQVLIHTNPEATVAAIRASGVRLEAPRGLATIVRLYAAAVPETPAVSVDNVLKELALFPAHREAPDLNGIDLARHVDNRFARDAVNAAR